MKRRTREKIRDNSNDLRLTDDITGNKERRNRIVEKTKNSKLDLLGYI